MIKNEKMFNKKDVDAFKLHSSMKWIA